MQAHLILSTYSYAKNAYSKNDNSNTNLMFVLKFKTFIEKIKHQKKIVRKKMKNGVIPTQMF